MRYDCRTHVSKLAAQTVTVRHQTKSLIAPLRSIERKKKTKPGDQSIFIVGGGRGEREFEGGSQSFQEEQKEDQTSPTEYKVQDNCR